MKSNIAGPPRSITAEFSIGILLADPAVGVSEGIRRLLRALSEGDQKNTGAVDEAFLGFINFRPRSMGGFDDAIIADLIGEEMAGRWIESVCVGLLKLTAVPLADTLCLRCGSAGTFRIFTSDDDRWEREIDELACDRCGCWFARGGDEAT